MSEFYGNQISGKWRGYIDSVSVINDYPDRAVIRAVCGFQATGWGFQIHGLRAVMSINENAKSEGGKSVSLPSGSWGKVGFIQHDVSVPKGTSGMNIRVAADVVNETGYYSGVSHVEGSCWISAKQSYTISYNANGGSGAPGNQTRWYGQSDFHLSSTRPTRTGYTFQGWSTSNDSSVEYQPGQHYGGDANLTLYAVWSVNTWTVSYNANGGSGAPGNQTKVYGQTLTLSSTRPTRNLYNFIDWGTSSNSTTPSYQPGGAYTNNASATLYAIWELAWLEPRITNLQATRCDSAGTLKEDGQYAKVTFNWATDRAMAEVRITCNGKNYYPHNEGGPTSGNVDIVIGDNSLSTENQYPVIIYIRDTVGDVSVTSVVPPMNYIIDVKSGGRGVSFGRPSTEDGVDIAWPLMPRIGTYLTTFLHGENGTYGPWVKLGTWDNVYSQGSVAIVRIYGGEGQNGDPSQNTTMTVFIKKGFTGAGDGLFFGTHVLVENATEHSNIRFKVIQENDHKCTLWWYSKWHYDQFSVSTECTHGSIWTNAQQNDWSASEPTGKTCRTDVEFIPTYNRIFPVGSIVIRYDHTSPASLYGGTWLRLAGRFLYPAGANEAIGGTGGSGTHTLTVDQMPSHVHNFSHSFTVSGGGSGASGIPGGQSGWGSYAPADWFRMAYSGGNKPHNNNPAYINVSVWRRTE